MKIELRPQTELKTLLKLLNLVGSGGEAKFLIKEGKVKLNGEVETRVGKKLFNGDIVSFAGEEIVVTVNED